MCWIIRGRLAIRVLFPNKGRSERGAESFKSAWVRARDKALKNGLENDSAERYRRK